MLLTSLKIWLVENLLTFLNQVTGASNNIHEIAYTANYMFAMSFEFPLTIRNYFGKLLFKYKFLDNDLPQTVRGK